jgi:hypothetical protein
VLLEILGPQEQLVLREQRETLAPLEQLVLLVVQDLRGLKEFKAQLVLLGLKVFKVILDLLVQPDQPEI